MSDLPIAMTVGEPSGIGPDIFLQLLNNTSPLPSLLVFADIHCLEERAQQLGLSKRFLSQHPNIDIVNIQLAVPCVTGQPNPHNAESVIKAIEEATQSCIMKRCRALVTGPVHKATINQASIPFTGHTELLAQLTQTEQTVMMLTTQQLKVALATTHLPLSEVPQALTKARLKRCIEIIYHDLKALFHITQPRITICGLNPHAGEEGHLGKEEITIITPTIKKLKQAGMCLFGPVSADTAFTKQSLKETDIILAMYHDQGLPAIKAINFSEAVNITLGLPILRTSVDHGVAFSLAGTGHASNKSLIRAIHYAHTL